MRVKITKTKNTTQYTIIKDIYRNNKRTTCVYENLGTIEKIKERAEDEEPLEWLKNYVAELNKKHKEESLPVIIRKSPNKLIDKNVQNSFNVVSYLILCLVLLHIRILLYCYNNLLFYQPFFFHSVNIYIDNPVALLSLPFLMIC